MDLGSQTFCLSRYVENIDTRGMELPPFCLHIYFHLNFFIIPSLFFLYLSCSCPYIHIVL